MKTAYILILAIIVVMVIAPNAMGGWFLDTETGATFNTLNDVRISGNSGTRFSLVDDLDLDPTAFIRLRLGYTIKDRHTISALYAPLTFHATGTLEKNIDFNDETYSKGDKVRARYQFNSYRLTYRYDFFLSEKLDTGIGLTGKVRDAVISLDGRKYSEYTNLGFVPLLNFRLHWKFTDKVGLLLDGDALVSTQGRAEDVFLGFTAKANSNVNINFGYRILEGGADNEKVYTFALIHYASVGLTAKF